MNAFFVGIGTVLFLSIGSPTARAFDCAKAYLPVDFVICSDPTAINANEAHEKAWYAARERLNDAEKQELLQDQRNWLKEYPPRCGVPAKGKSLAIISKDEQLCVAKALEERKAFLQQYHNRATEASSPPVAVTNSPTPGKSLAAISSLDCATFAALANSELNDTFGTTNHSGSWVTEITNLAKGDSNVGPLFQRYANNKPQSVGQLLAAFLGSNDSGASLYLAGETTTRALLLGLALEPQSIGIIAQALYRGYGVVAGQEKLRSLVAAMVDEVTRHNPQVRAAIQANIGASGRICN